MWWSGLTCPADDKVMQAAEAKRQKKKKQGAEDNAREEGNLSIAGKGPGTDGGPPTASKRNRKASFALEGGDATVVVNATQGGASSFTAKGLKVTETPHQIMKQLSATAIWWGMLQTMHCSSVN